MRLGTPLLVLCLVTLVTLAAAVYSHEGHERDHKTKQKYKQQPTADRRGSAKTITDASGGSQKDAFAARYPHVKENTLAATGTKQTAATGSVHDKRSSVKRNVRGSIPKAINDGDHEARDWDSLVKRIKSYFMRDESSGNQADKPITGGVDRFPGDLGESLYNNVIDEINEENVDVGEEKENEASGPESSEDKINHEDDADDEDVIFIDWNDEGYEYITRPKKYSIVSELLHAAVNFGSKVIEFSTVSVYVYHAVVAVVVVLWLVNALLFVGLWRVPKLRSTMRTKPSPDHKSKRAGPTRSAKDSRWSRSKRRRRLEVCQEPQQTDSTIATVTVFIGEDGAEEGVEVVKNTAAAAGVVVDGCGLAVDSDSLESEESQQKSNPRHLQEAQPRDTDSDFPKVCRKRRKSKERYSCNTDESALAVYDLEDRASLPAEILDLLSCPGGKLCFHDHDRLRVDNNKVYIYTKHQRSSSRQSKRRTSPFQQSPHRRTKTKRVTFSPVNKHRGTCKIRKLRRESVSPGPDSNAAEEEPVPPPPSGYHIRVDPSNPDSLNETLVTDDSTWTQIDGETVSGFTHKNSHAESLASMENSPESRSYAKQHLPIKKVKDHFRKTMGPTPHRFTKCVKIKTKKHRFDSNHVSTTEKANMGPKRPQTMREVYGSGDFGVTEWEVPSSEGVRKSSVGNVGEQARVCSEKESNRSECESSIGLVKPGAVRTSTNRGRLRHTIQEGTDANMNNNSSLDSAVLAASSQKRISTDSTPVVNTSNSHFSYIFQIHFLNVNMNALPGNGNAHEEVPGNHQEVTLEQNLSSTTPSVDQFYTPEGASLGAQPEANSEASPVDCVEELCQHHLEVVLPDLKFSPITSPISLRDEIQQQATQVESETECWEAKKHSIMMACNEAIKNRLKRQELEEEEPIDFTSSESASVKNSREKRKKRKTKTTESVYVKFKTSLSKKMTTTTTLKEVKQSSHGVSAKTLMLENDHQNVRSLTSQSSEQSLSIPQPRHTRIVKCGEFEKQVRKRRLSSDTEVELIHSIDVSKQLVEFSKNTKEVSVRDRQMNKMENTCVETSVVEEHSTDFDRQDDTECSPQQNLIIGHGELVGEHDKLSEKASAITVINVMDTLDAASKTEKTQSPETAVRGEPESSPVEGMIHTASLSLACQSGSVTLEAPANKERVKRRNKSTKQNGKKKSELKRVVSKTRDTVEASETPQTLQSETSLSKTSKKICCTSSTSKNVRHATRSHSSPPDCRKKKSSSKKKTTVHLFEPTEADSKRSHRMRKKSPDKKRKFRTSALRDEKPRKTGSTSSTNSEKKRKSQTTASSISIDSVEDGHQRMQKISPERENISPETEVTLPRSELDLFEPSNVLESPHISAVQKEILHKVDSQEVAPQKLKNQKTGARTVKQFEIGDNRVCEPVPQPSENNVSKPKLEAHGHQPDDAPIPLKVVNKVSSKMAHAKASFGNMPKEKDLQKAEMGWNNSIFYSLEDKRKAAGAKARCTPRRPKLKYVLVKAKDKTKEKKQLKEEKEETLPLLGEANSPREEASDQTIKQDGQGDSSLRGQSKTVQFSESIEKIENLKQTDILEEAESIEEQAQETHIGDNASDGSLGDMFLSNNFDLVRELVEEEAEDKQEQQPESAPKVVVASQLEKKKSSSPRRNRRPVWLKKATVKPPEDPVVVETRIVLSKQNVSPNRLEKTKESFEEVILQPKKCNIQVTNPLTPSGLSPKGEMTSVKARVAYSSMLSNVFLSLPLKRGARRAIAQTGSPVDIKEVIEGSSVDAADYAKNLRYSPKAKRASAVVSTGAGRKKGALEPRTRSPRGVLVGSGSARSLVSRDCEADHKVTTANCSFSTDLDEAAVYRPVHSAPSNRGTRAARKKWEQQETCGASSGRVSCLLPWQLVGGGSDQDGEERPQLSYVQVAGDLRESSILNLGLSWLMQEFFSRFDFLNPRRHLRPISHRQASELSLEPPAQEQPTFAAV